MSAEPRPTLTVRTVRDAAEHAAALELRLRVFCDEQGVGREEELDEHEQTSTHLVTLDESGVIATCRLRFMDEDCKLERMAVERPLRRRGVGAQLLAEAESVAAADGAGLMVLHAQARARDFYAAHGYEPEGGLFMEANIEHIRMTKPLLTEAPEGAA